MDFSPAVNKHHQYLLQIIPLLHRLICTPRSKDTFGTEGGITRISATEQMMGIFSPCPPTPIVYQFYYTWGPFVKGFDFIFTVFQTTKTRQNAKLLEIKVGESHDPGNRNIARATLLPLSGGKQSQRGSPFLLPFLESQA